MDKVLVSIIMSVYNEEKYISKSVESILGQTLRDFEFIIIDDGSTDATADIINSYSDNRIRLIKNEVNVGLTKNLNKAIEISKGKYIARMDGDDIAYLDRLEKQVTLLEENSDIAMISCMYKKFGQSHEVMPVFSDYEQIKVKLLFHPCLPHPGFLFRKQVFQELDLKYSEAIKYAQDYDLQVRASRLLKISNLEEILFKYRVHKDQVSIQKRDLQKQCAMRIKKSQLEYMGINLNKKALDFFCNGIPNSKKPSNVRNLVLLDAVLYEIWTRNKSKGYYQESFLKEELNKRFFIEYKKIFNYAFFDAVILNKFKIRNI